MKKIVARLIFLLIAVVSFRSMAASKVEFQVFSRSQNVMNLPKSFWKSRNSILNPDEQKSAVLPPAQSDTLLDEVGLFSSFEFQDQYAKDMFISSVKTLEIEELIRRFPDLEPQVLRRLKSRLQ